jgi:PHP family Zn ribbon phosphoesterase
VVFSPDQTKANDYLCPVCKKRLTVGVMHRIGEMADRAEGFIPSKSIPSIHLIPLEEIIAQSLGVGVGTKAVEAEYERLIGAGGSEFAVLVDLSPEELKRFTSPRILEGIVRMRQGKLHIAPGHDGVYGKVSIFSQEERGEGEASEQQMNLF